MTIPTSSLPKPNECNNTKEQRTNAEILQELSSTGLVSDASKPSVILENVKPGGVSFEVHLTTVRPKTAKGQRVPKPPRRLESLEVETDSEKRQRMEEISAKIKSKQEKASLKRQVGNPATWIFRDKTKSYKSASYNGSKCPVGLLQNLTEDFFLWFKTEGKKGENALRTSPFTDMLHGHERKNLQ